MLDQNAPVRQQHDLIQGDSSWHEFRAQHIGASEIAAVLGLSKYTSRTELLKIKSTGIAPEIDANTQRIFNRGHETEAMARPIAEKIIGDELYATTWSFGRLSASCDGLNMMETIGFEHKQFNKALFEQVSAGELPDSHMPQVQQCLLVTGAEKWLFMVSDGTEENCAHMWVYPEQSWFDRIEAAAEQFYIDLANYSPEPEYIPATATLVDDLMLPSIIVTGSIAVESNLELFGGALTDYIGRINTSPETDQDFVNINKAIKSLEKAEEWLDKQEEDVIAKFDDLNRTISLKNSLKELARENRLTLQKIEKAKKESCKAEIVNKAKVSLLDHVSALQAELTVTLHTPAVNFADAIKGKSKLDAMTDAVNTMLANAKIAADGIAKDLREKHTWYFEHAAAYSFLFSDMQQLIYKDFDSFKAVAQNRILTHKEQEKAKAEAAAKAQAEREERIRIEAASAAKREFEQEQAKAKADLESIEINPAVETAPIEIIPGVVIDQPVGFKPAQQAPGATALPTRKQILAVVGAKFFLTDDESIQAIELAFGTAQQEDA